MPKLRLVALIAAAVLAASSSPAGAADAEAAAAAKYAKTGFHVALDDGRLWVLRQGSEELAQFLEHGEPAKQVVRPGAGPDGITLKSADAEVLDAYLAAGL